MFCDTVTLFCRFGPPRAEAFTRTVLKGVRFDGAAGANASARFFKSADRAVLFIPFSSADGYVSPAAWEALCAEQRQKHWTLRPGDIVLSGDAGHSALAFSAQLAAAPIRYVLTTVDEKDTHSPLAHFEVGCGRIYRQGGGVS